MSAPHASVRWQLWIVAFGFFMQTLNTTIVNTALSPLLLCLLSLCGVMSLGVTLTGLLLGTFAQHAATASPQMIQAFIWSWLCMALIIALPVLIFWRVPEETHTNAPAARRRTS